ncbi:MAG: LamG domain-containing protein, partial [Sedimentisphaerales bacterium]
MYVKSLFLTSFVLVLGSVSYTWAVPNLVAHYEFEGVADYNDSVGGGLAGEPKGNAQVIWDDDRGSYVLSLDGDGDYVYFGTEWNYIVETAMTVAAWIKPNSLAKWEAIASRGYAWRLKGWEDGKVAFQVMNTNPTRVVGTKDVNDGAWHHVAATYDGTEYNLYVDGRLDASVSATGAIKPGTAYYGCIGAFYKKAHGAPRWFFDGLIDDVRIYDRVLSEAEIREIGYVAEPRASEPSPADGQTDVPRDVVLGWTPGDYAPPVNGHTVYFSDSFDDVKAGIGGITQSANSYAPAQHLDFGKTYY